METQRQLALRATVSRLIEMKQHGVDHGPGGKRDLRQDRAHPDDLATHLGPERNGDPERRAAVDDAGRILRAGHGVSLVLAVDQLVRRGEVVSQDADGVGLYSLALG